jgi:hypothetical protein
MMFHAGVASRALPHRPSVVYHTTANYSKELEFRVSQIEQSLDLSIYFLNMKEEQLLET